MVRIEPGRPEGSPTRRADVRIEAVPVSAAVGDREPPTESPDPGHAPTARLIAAAVTAFAATISGGVATGLTMATRGRLWLVAAVTAGAIVLITIAGRHLLDQWEHTPGDQRARKRGKR